MPVAVSTPISVDYGTGGRIFPGQHVGATNGRVINGHQVEASLGADAVLELLFPLPPSNPGGTLKLLISSFADVAATQSGFLRVLWAALAAAENFDTITLNNEHGGGDLEIEHTTGEDDELVSTLVTLDADTITYGTDRYLLMHIEFESASWDLAVLWTLLFSLVWE